MKKILILGGSGMLGFGVAKAFCKYEFDVTITFRNYRKISNFRKLNPYNNFTKFEFFDAEKTNDKKLRKLLSRFDYVLNCIGIIKPEIKEECPKSVIKAFKVNSYFPRLVSKNLSKKTKFFQIATDCVFSGNKGMYDETDLHDQNDVYGMTKSLGEVKNNKNFFNLRTSIIGREFNTKKSLLEWFCLQKKNSIINGFVNHFWNGLTTEVYGHLVATIIKFNINVPNILHLLPKNKISKYYLVNLFNKKFQKKLKIKKFKTNFFSDRTLDTINSKLVNKIWKKSIYKKKLSIEQMIEIL